MGKPTSDDEFADNRCLGRSGGGRNLPNYYNTNNSGNAYPADSNIAAGGPDLAGNSGKNNSRHQQYNDTEASQLGEQIAKYGMSLNPVQKDGNCLFGAVADQLYRDPLRHREVRQECVRYMEAHPQQFQSFVPDEPLRRYLDRMQCDGEWGGNLEIKAMSELFRADIIVHTAGKPPIKVRAAEPCKVLHLAYLGGSHYDSVRYVDPELAEEDMFRWMDFTLSGDGIMKSAPAMASPATFGNFDELIAQVVSLGPWTREEAAQALTMADGDVDTAFALLESFAPTNFVS